MLTQYYNNRIIELQDRLAKAKRSFITISTLRLIVFVATIVACWCLWGYSLAVLSIIIVGTMAFLALVKQHGKIEQTRTLLEARVSIAQDEIRRLSHDYSQCSKGRRFIDPAHDYAYDLDLFGHNSIFSMVDRCATTAGQEILANWLKRPETVRDSIEQRQKAVAEIAQLDEIRNDFRAKGITSHGTNTDEPWNENNIPDFSVSPIIRILSYLLPITLIAVIVLYSFDIIGGNAILYTISVTLLIAAAQMKRVTALHRWLDKTLRALSVYHPLIATLETTRFSSEYLQQLADNIKCDGTPASERVKALSSLLHNLDQRYNVIGYIVLNGTMLWDYRQMASIHKWLTANSAKISGWINTISEFDALCSLGGFYFNNPKYSFPKVDSSGNIVMQAEQLGHPLIPVSKCVTNPLEALSVPSFRVVTGANMAGKSTFLRTVGVNYVLACIGAPVFATNMVFSPISLFTGLRTTDSLQDNESYFFAELKRLQQIVQRSAGGERMFIILDEILKGTNSTDKRYGSLALVSNLIKHNITGIIATHDLELGTLAQTFPGIIDNLCFEADISGDTLSFSYRIHHGTAQNMNACFLMEKMGIIPPKN